MASDGESFPSFFRTFACSVAPAAPLTQRVATCVVAVVLLGAVLSDEVAAQIALILSDISTEFVTVASILVGVLVMYLFQETAAKSPSPTGVADGGFQEEWQTHSTRDSAAAGPQADAGLWRA
mmetsp:Transcript_32039/g.70187  ORF Transcript_32039/g.70187 Transcript_32039/m.70187 type:complete len:123 (-) Transcript_32039:46-414(-)